MCYVVTVNLSLCLEISEGDFSGMTKTNLLSPVSPIKEITLVNNTDKHREIKYPSEDCL